MQVNLETVAYTWVVIGIMCIFALTARWLLLWHPNSLVSYALKWAVRLMVRTVKNTCQQVPRRYVSFFSALFIFLLISNCLMIIPTLEEPTKDINTTLALSVLMFLFIQGESICRHGLFAYINEIFKMPFAVRGVYSHWNILSVLGIAGRSAVNIVLGLLTLPLELLGKLSSIISLAFRLFGNIFAGSVIASGWMHVRSGSWALQLLGLISGLNLVVMLFFGIFEGVVQAFVFVMLGLSALGRALQHHE